MSRRAYTSTNSTISNRTRDVDEEVFISTVWVKGRSAPNHRQENGTQRLSHRSLKSMCKIIKPETAVPTLLPHLSHSKVKNP